MAEPVTPAIATPTVLVAAPTIAVLFQVWPFGLAFFAGCVALLYMSPMPPLAAIRSVVGAVLAGGAFSQVAARPTLHFLGSFNTGLLAWSQEPDANKFAIALLAMLIGLFAQAVIPKMLVRAGNEVGGQP